MKRITQTIAPGARALFATLALFLVAGCGQAPEASRVAVPDDPANVRPLLPGMTVPAFTAPDPDGRERRFAPGELERPLVVTFYRGGWCPYCSKHLMAYRDIEPELLELGYELLFVSPDRPEVSKQHLADSDFEITLLSDSEMAISRAFGLAFRVDEDTVRRYREEHDIDIEGDSGQTHHLLPVPATYVIGTDGVVRFMYANPNYRDRLDPALLVTAARLASAEDAEG
jgi:peroxiredoxin